MTPRGMRQIDSGIDDQRTAGLYRALFALAAHELGGDPARALAVDWQRFSPLNPFHALASDARALGFYLTVTGYDVPAARLGEVAGFKKQIVSAAIARVEEARSRPGRLHRFDAPLLRMEKMLGVVS